MSLLYTLDNVVFPVINGRSFPNDISRINPRDRPRWRQARLNYFNNIVKPYMRRQRAGARLLEQVAELRQLENDITRRSNARDDWLVDAVRYSNRRDANNAVARARWSNLIGRSRRQ